jgi:high-affinity iron transporter
MTPLLTSAFVIAREGLEAWLLAMLALTAVGKNQSQIRAIYFALAGAILATLALGSITVQILGNHANIERFEAVISLFTAVVLGYVAWFCHGASQHLKSLPTHNSLLLGVAVFAVLFREGIEVVIFLGGIIVSTTDQVSVGMGVLVGLVILVLLGMFGQKHIQRIPTRLVFKYSRYIFAVLAIYFAYNGATELLEYY